MDNSNVKVLEIYTVLAGDSLWKIAQKYQVGIRELILANPQIANPDLIQIGQTINIPAGSTYQSMEKEVIRLVNNERARNGLSPLTENWEVSRVARYKSQDMVDNNYFDHNSPVYGTPFKMLTDFGVRYNTAAENIAYGQRSAAEVMNTWMNSSGHRANILNPSFNQIGVGIARRGSNGPLYFTQLFIGN